MTTLREQESLIQQRQNSIKQRKFNNRRPPKLTSIFGRAYSKYAPKSVQKKITQGGTFSKGQYNKLSPSIKKSLSTGSSIIIDSSKNTFNQASILAPSKAGKSKAIRFINKRVKGDIVPNIKDIPKFISNTFTSGKKLTNAQTIRILNKSPKAFEIYMKKYIKSPSAKAPAIKPSSARVRYTEKPPPKISSDIKNPFPKNFNKKISPKYSIDRQEELLLKKSAIKYNPKQMAKIKANTKSIIDNLASYLIKRRICNPEISDYKS